MGPEQGRKGAPIGIGGLLGPRLFGQDVSAARAAMTSVKDMHRATTFEATNSHSISRTEFARMAQIADECLTKVASLDKVGPQVVRTENTSCWRR
ncbi:hypothetical protein HII36_44320 [Nonomuraea sp. NN258]|uniref:hypothetical protein n=1 Tax=Nonomuraea antri TaxID=2730852 RepID=UPI0015699BD9|nr:hypothetical protein [Nonomuraea antri]NRQ38803.1 hypothetical protein [Nonomuraea antri]